MNTLVKVNKLEKFFRSSIDMLLAIISFSWMTSQRSKQRNSIVATESRSKWAFTTNAITPSWAKPSDTSRMSNCKQWRNVQIILSLITSPKHREKCSYWHITLRQNKYKSTEWWKLWKIKGMTGKRTSLFDVHWTFSRCFLSFNAKGIEKDLKISLFFHFKMIFYFAMNRKDTLHR